MASHAGVVREIGASLGTDHPFHRYSDYLMRRFGVKTYRVSVDAGFSCPVRQTNRPCTYCDSSGSRAPYLGNEDQLESQIQSARRFLGDRYGARKFLLYFQAFSNTFGSVPDLRRVYDKGLSTGEFAGLIVSTRPDCVDEPVARLLAEYRSRGYEVWVELGLQSAHDRSLRRIRRGHSVAEFDRAVALLQARGIRTAAHLILGLPGESIDDMRATTRHLNHVGIDGVKFHNLVVVTGTELARQHAAGLLRPPTPEQYLDQLISCLEVLNPGIVVMRLTCDPPPGTSSVPGGLTDKSAFYARLVAEMRRRGTWQGRRLDTELDLTVT